MDLPTLFPSIYTSPPFLTSDISSFNNIATSLLLPPLTAWVLLPPLPSKLVPPINKSSFLNLIGALPGLRIKSSVLIGVSVGVTVTSAVPVGVWVGVFVGVSVDLLFLTYSLASLISLFVFIPSEENEVDKPKAPWVWFAIWSYLFRFVLQTCL